MNYSGFNEITIDVQQQSSEVETFFGDTIQTTENTLLGNKEKIEKTGKVGKLIIKHKKIFICALLSLAMLGIASILWVGGMYFFSWLRLTAAGVRYKFGDSSLVHFTVKLDSGIVVERVFEPIAPVSDEWHAMLLRYDLQQRLREDSLQVALSAGYSEWTVVHGEKAYNYTFSGVRKFAHTVLKEEEPVCVCFAQLGIPISAVFVRSSGNVLYDPFVVSENPKSDQGISQFHAEFRSLLWAAAEHERGRKATGTMPAYNKTHIAGMVRYVTETGLLGRLPVSEKDGELLPCIKQCIEVIEI